MYTVGELFAGIGGFSLAFHATGQVRTAWFVEREPYPQKVLSKNFPDVTIYGDIYDCHDLPYVDIITAGFPCQPFSVAGKREGENDERYLVPEMFRVISEVKPRVVFFENVSGFASITDGDTFKQFLRTLAEMGFDAEWGHLAASDVGAPHRRERWFCVAYAQSADNQRERRGLARPTRQAWKQNDGAKPHRQNQNRTIRLMAGRGTEAIDISSRPNSGPKLVARLGRNAHGLSARLDGHHWPARPGQPQHAWEPPRVTDRRENQTARLKALGNAVVPQVVYPIAQSICEWLASQDVAEKVS